MRNKEQSYQDWYEGVSAFFLERPFLLGVLRFYNLFMTVLMPVSYACFLLYLGWERFWLYALVPATGFVLLSLIRKVINQARPYDTYPIQPLLEKDSVGNSMPSRHVFSATVISMAVYHDQPLVGGFFLLLSAGLALVRVLGGVHYPKDVLVGYLVGVLWGTILYLV